ncbi:MAG: hypothetical protein KDI05_08730 [Halieaceae bacterium]|nr:hypothetical protein [Halieaceae bacterium]MCP5205313.1 hypothetical protein [Pseudomonadales bacterium]
MKDSDKRPTETETILMALDQIGQTIDVMTSVVGRLRSYVQEREAAAGVEKSPPAGGRADQTLH